MSLEDASHATLLAYSSEKERGHDNAQQPMDFTVKTALRNFELRLPSISFFVSLPLLASISEYFEAVFRDNFRESREGYSEITDLDPEVVVLFLRYVCPDDDRRYCRRITADNVGTLLMLAYRFMVNSMRDDILAFVSSKQNLRSITDSYNFALQFIYDVQELDSRSPLIPALVTYLEESGYDTTESMKQNSLVLRPKEPMMVPRSVYNWNDFERRMFT